MNVLGNKVLAAGMVNVIGTKKMMRLWLQKLWLVGWKCCLLIL